MSETRGGRKLAAETKPRGGKRFLYKYDGGSVWLDAEAYPRRRQVALVELVMSAINDSVKSFEVAKARRSAVWTSASDVYKLTFVDSSNRRGQLEYCESVDRLGDPKTRSEIVV